MSFTLDRKPDLVEDASVDPLVILPFFFSCVEEKRRNRSLAMFVEYGFPVVLADIHSS